MACRTHARMSHRPPLSLPPPPQNRALALSLYNSFMYVGRALSFGILTLSTTLTHSTGFDGKSRALLVPLNQLDLSKVRVGTMAQAS